MSLNARQYREAVRTLWHCLQHVPGMRQGVAGERGDFVHETLRVAVCLLPVSWACVDVRDVERVTALEEEGYAVVLLGVDQVLRDATDAAALVREAVSGLPPDTSPLIPDV